MSDDKDGIGELKREVFYRLLDMAGRVFIHVRHSDSVIIGKRGFLDHERESGIVLVINRKMRFDWHDGVLDARLVFGSVPENCVVPEEEILAIYSPELKVQFLAAPETESATDHQKENGDESVKGTDLKKKTVQERISDKIIEVDFRKKGDV